jgi:hypothetical protein
MDTGDNHSHSSKEHKIQASATLTNSISTLFNNPSHGWLVVPAAKFTFGLMA